MKVILSALFTLTTFCASAQTFFVEPTDKGYEKTITEKLDFDGIKVTPDKSIADYVLSIHYQKNKRNYKFEGYVKASDKAGVEVYRSKIIAKAASAFNGYQALPAILTSIAEKDLIPAIKKGF